MNRSRSQLIINFDQREFEIRSSCGNFWLKTVPGRSGAVTLICIFLCIVFIMHFNLRYFCLTILIFLIEVCIAVFFNDQFIRPFIGDVLVVILIYCFVRAFWKVRVDRAIASIFIFSYTIELLQYFSLVDRLGLRNNKIASTIVGTTFDWKDLLAYAIGCGIVLGLDGKFGRRKNNSDR